MNVCTKTKHLHISLHINSKMYFLLIYHRKKNNSIFVFDNNFYTLNLLKSCIISKFLKYLLFLLKYLTTYKCIFLYTKIIFNSRYEKIIIELVSNFQIFYDIKKRCLQRT